MASLSPQQHRSRFGDTTLTKVFVGGLAWETPTEVFRNYFEQFGEILEAVIITDKNTGRSKGYGFVTFRDPESARRSVANPNPEIDGRRANCNIASQGRPRPDPPRVRNQSIGGAEQGPPAHASGPSYRMRAQMPPPPQFYYSTQYGYMPYPSGYGYQQGMYNPQIAAQYYQQYYAQSSTSSGGPQPYPYPYMSYALQSPSPRPGFPSPFHPQRQQYIQYNNNAMLHSNEAAFDASLPQNFQLQAPPNARQTSNTADSQTDQQSSGGANSESPDG